MEDVPVARGVLVGLGELGGGHSEERGQDDDKSAHFEEVWRLKRPAREVYLILGSWLVLVV